MSMPTTAHPAAGAAPLMTSAGARITAEVATWGHAKRAAAMQDVTALELQSLPQELLARIAWGSLICARLARSFERHGAKRAEQEVLGRLLCTSRIFHGAVKDVLQSRAVALGQEVERLPTPELNFDERHIRTLKIAALGQLTMVLHEAIQDAVTQDLEGLLTLKVVTQDGNYIEFKMRNTTKIGKAITAFCNRQGRSIGHDFCLRKHWECSDDLLRQLPVPQWMQDHPDQYEMLLAQQVQHGKCDLSLYGCWHETPDALGLKNDDVLVCWLAAQGAAEACEARDQLFWSLHELWLQESRRKWAFSLRARNPFGGVAPEAHGERALPCAAMVHGS